MTADASMPPDDLKSKVAAWLDKEGYPLEFRTANSFRRAGFRVRQSEYVRAEDGDKVREIDVAASKTWRLDKPMLRVYHVVECKWTKDKPWVVFSSPETITSSACIT